MQITNEYIGVTAFHAPVIMRNHVATKVDRFNEMNPNVTHVLSKLTQNSTDLERVKGKEN